METCLTDKPDLRRDSRSPMVPAFVRVRRLKRETHDTFTLSLDSPGADYSFLPGQFNMLYAFGVGEVPISMSGDAAQRGRLLQTIRSVGNVTQALARCRAGDVVGVRGPYGSSWPMEAAQGQDVVIVTGGIGLAPLRPAIYHLLRHRADYGRVVLLYGARTPADLLYKDELEKWRGRFDVQVLVTVDRADAQWLGHVGVVTTLFNQAEFDSARCVGLACGPEVMMRFAIREFEGRGVPGERLYVSLERNMQCAVGLCGHCQFGPSFVCMDGPVFRFDRIRSFFGVREA